MEARCDAHRPCLRERVGFSHSLCAGTRDGINRWGHQGLEGTAGEDSGPPRGTVRASAGHSPGPRPGAAGGAAGTRRRRGGHGAAWVFSRGGGGDAESRNCHRFSPLSCPRGLKQKRKRMRLAGRPVWSCGPPPPPGRGHLSAPAAGRPGRGEPGRLPAGARPKSGHVRAAPGPRGRRPPRAGAAAATTAARIFGHAG